MHWLSCKSDTESNAWAAVPLEEVKLLISFLVLDGEDRAKSIKGHHNNFRFLFLFLKWLISWSIYGKQKDWIWRSQCEKVVLWVCIFVNRVRVRVRVREKQRREKEETTRNGDINLEMEIRVHLCMVGDVLKNIQSMS